MKSFVYNDERHEYLLDGKKMTGVTTVLGSVGGAGGLIQWAANEAVKVASAKINSGKAYTEDELAAIFAEAKNAHRKKKEDAGDLGTESHLVCELFEQGKDYSHLSEEAQLRAKPYIDWYKKEVAESLFVERPLFSRAWFVGGTPDGGFRTKEGKNLINDKKFKNKIYDSKAYWQMAAYQEMIEEMSNDTETTVRLEWKDGTIEEYKNPQEYLGSLGKVEWDGCVVLLMDGKEGVQPLYRFAYGQDLPSFLAALTIYKTL